MAGKHYLSSGIVCRPREHVTWMAGGITRDPKEVTCKRCNAYLRNPLNFTDRVPLLPPAP